MVSVICLSIRLKGISALNSDMYQKTNKRISRYLMVAGTLILGIGLDCYLLGIGNDWLIGWGLGTLLASICYRTSCWTEGEEINPILARGKPYEFNEFSYDI